MINSTYKVDCWSKYARKQDQEGNSAHYYIHSGGLYHPYNIYPAFLPKDNTIDQAGRVFKYNIFSKEWHDTEHSKPITIGSIVRLQSDSSNFSNWNDNHQWHYYAGIDFLVIAIHDSVLHLVEIHTTDSPAIDIFVSKAICRVIALGDDSVELKCRVDYSPTELIVSQELSALKNTYLHNIKVEGFENAVTADIALTLENDAELRKQVSNLYRKNGTINSNKLKKLWLVILKNNKHLSQMMKEYPYEHKYEKIHHPEYPYYAVSVYPNVINWDEIADYLKRKDN